MTPFQNVAITILITIYARALTCNELFDVNMINDFRYHFRANWIITQTCKKIDYPIINLVNEIKNSMHVYTNIFEWKDFLSAADYGLQGVFKPVVLVTCWACPLDCLTPINEMPKLMKKFTWILLRRENTSFNLNNINIPINTLFIVIEKLTPDIYKIREAYRISAGTDLIYLPYGIWSSQQGLNCTATALVERRSNFFGKNITTRMEPDNSTNPLKHIYINFIGIYFNMAKRLNFTIDPKTRPEEDHEVSVVLDWADAPLEKVPFLPFYESRQSIFFKDIGVGIQLDGYITPFQTTVWLAVIFVAILAGILSYIAANVYVRMTRNKKLPRRIDFYLFKNFYMLCQKSEIGEKYTVHRIITLSQWIISIFLINCYSAIFISFISVDIPKPPFTTIDELLVTKGYNIVTSKYMSQSTLLFLQTNGDPKLRKLYETHFDPVKNSIEFAPETFCAGKKYLFITSEVHMTLMKNSPGPPICQISKNQISLYSRYLTWFIEKDNQYMRILQAFLLKAYTGGLLQNYFVQKTTFTRRTNPQDFRNITLEDTVMLFIIIGTGFLLSIIIFLLEIVYKKIKE